MNKYSEIADRMKRLRTSHDARLEALATRMDSHESQSDVVFRAYEGAIEDQEAGMKILEENVKDMRNAMSKDEGGKTDTTVAKFPANSETTKTA